MPKKTGKKTKEKKPEPELEQIPEYTDDFGKILATWNFPEFIKHAKGKWWYISFTIIFVALIIYSYFADNMLFAIIIVIFTILYLSIENKGPINMEVLITEDGLVLNGKLVEYENLENFYIIYYPPRIKNLYFQPKSTLGQRIVIPLENQNPVEIRHILLDYLDEDLDKEEIPSSESISHLLKL